MPKKTKPEIYHYELKKESGIVFIQWIFDDNTRSEWLIVGEAPYPKGY